MCVGRGIFPKVGGGGRGLWGVRKNLPAGGGPTPGGARSWTQVFVRSAILDDVYRPHTYEEVKALVTPEVAVRLDPNESYGIFWHNTKSSTYTHFAQGGPGAKVYRKRRKVTPRP